MLKRIDELIKNEETFAFETTLASKMFVGIINNARAKNYEVVLLFLFLNSKELAVERVKTRVNEGGHNIPKEVINRRYERGLNNLFNLYMNKIDKWLLVDNSEANFNFIAKGGTNQVLINNKYIWKSLKEEYNGN